MISVVDRIVSNYNKKLFKLLKEVEENFPENGELYFLRNRMITFKREQREGLIELSGRFLYIYKDELYAQAKDSNGTFFKDISNIKEIDSSHSEYKTINSLFSLISSYYYDVNEQERTKLCKDVLLMFDDFLEYVKNTGKVDLLK